MGGRRGRRRLRRHRPRPTTRRSRSTTSPASRCRWPCCPTAGSCTTPATARSGSTTRRPGQPGHHHDPGLPARRGRPAVRRHRPRLRDQQVGLHLLRAAADHAGRRPGHAGRQRGRRAGHQHRPERLGRRSRATTSCPGSSWSRRRRRTWTWPPSSRSSGSTSTAASAATSAGEIKFDGEGLLYLVTGDDTNAGGSDGFTPINESPDPGPRLRRAALRRQHQRPARQAAADPGQRRRDVHRSRTATCSRAGDHDARPGRRSS